MTTTDIQIIGKGGAAREVAVFQPGLKWFFENEEIDDAVGDIPTVIAIGDGNVRKAIAEKYPDLAYGILVAPTVIRWNTTMIGEGTILCSCAHLTTNIKIGKHCLINVHAKIHHDCILGDYVTVGPSATICGNVTIGDLCFIGANAVIKEEITICEGVTIGCGGVVVKDITEPGVYVGNPVKKIK